MRRFQAADAQDMRGHRGGRCFSVHPGDENAAPLPHDGRERLRTACHFFPEPRGFVELDVARLDRGRVDHQFRVGHGVRGLRAEKSQAETLQTIRLDGSDFVRAADAMTEREQQARNAAHARSGNADEMHAERGAGEFVREDFSVADHAFASTSVSAV